MEKSGNNIRVKTTGITANKDKNLRIWSIRKPSEDLYNLPAALTSAISSHEEFDQWLTKCEKHVDDDVTSFKVLELQMIMEKRRALEELYNEIENYEQKNFDLSENFQRFCQMIPPCNEREEKKAMIRDTRSRLMRLRLKVVEQREIYRLAVPLLCHYCEHSLKIKSWLDETETRSRTYIDKHENDVTLLAHADETDALLQDIFEKKSIYEACLTYGEMAMYTVLGPFVELKEDLDIIVERWDTLCMKVETCLSRLEIAKKIEEESQKNEAERIDRQIQREAHKCNCHKAFEIIRVAEGKYTFGNSKIVRLVRIHGSSIVVRVGGGWEFLYEFLMRCDPCRAKEFLEDGVESLKKLGLKPIDDRRHSYAFESRRMYSPLGNNLTKTNSLQKCIANADDKDHDCEVKSLCSSADSLDGGSLGSDAGHACNRKTPKSVRNSGTGSSRRITSSGHIIGNPASDTAAILATQRPKTATPLSSRRPARRSLVERQGDYTEKGKLANFQRKLATSSEFV